MTNNISIHNLGTYGIEDGRGDLLTTGVSGYEIEAMAQRIADERAETVYVYALGEDADPLAIEAQTVRCACSVALGAQCAWIGPAADTVLVEWMPVHLRVSHEVAGNAGVYPHNGAERLRVTPACAERILADDSDWATVRV